MYRLVALARALDERMWVLNRAGRAPFVISGQGHEGAQVGMARALRAGVDWMAPFYRSIATCLALGMSPRDMMLRLRLQHAKNLLLESSLTIKEIAERCGYVRQHEFARSFRQQTGVTPRAWRLQPLARLSTEN